MILNWLAVLVLLAGLVALFVMDWRSTLAAIGVTALVVWSLNRIGGWIDGPDRSSGVASLEKLRAVVRKQLAEDE
jgi:hypothetical protein